MHEYLKEHPEKSFLLWQSVYIYHTNTKKKWSELTQKDKDNKNFKWFASKMFMLAKKPVTVADIEKYIKESPEFDDMDIPNSTNSKSSNPSDSWKHHSVDYVIYGWFPLTHYDVKLLFNVMSPRMLHLINN